MVFLSVPISERSHNKNKKYSKTYGMRKMSQEEYDRGINELRERINAIQMLLQREMEICQRRGWSMKKPIQW
jgi:hypothetical protein